MRRKPAKKAKSAHEYDSQRQQNVLLEDICRKVEIVAEGHSGLAKGIDEVKDTLHEHGSRFDRIESKLAEHSGTLAEHSGKFAEHEKRFDRIESAVMENSRGIKENGVSTKRIEQKLDTVIINHEQRIQKLETVN